MDLRWLFCDLSLCCLFILSNNLLCSPFLVFVDASQVAIWLLQWERAKEQVILLCMFLCVFVCVCVCVVFCCFFFGGGGGGIYSVCIAFSTPSGVWVGISNATTFYPYMKFRT